MLDFLIIDEKRDLDKKSGTIKTIISPDFKTLDCKDIMIRGGNFYAVWDEKEKLWSTSQSKALKLIDNELRKYADEYKQSHPDYTVKLRLSERASSKVIDDWKSYVTSLEDNYHNLDEKLIFSNMEIKREDYASKSLPYPLEKGSHEAWDELMSTLYSEEERKKIEWAIGSVVNGDSKKIQKFLVLYGSAGTGKSTVLNIIQKLFDGYFCSFDAKALGKEGTFALESFKTNPLVAIQHDGDLSKIEDNTRLNSLISHELMPVNEKYKSTYQTRFKSFCFMGTNRPVKITDAKSGILRRLIDVSPTGNKIPNKRYLELMNQIDFELGAIAYYCKGVYEKNKHLYDTYVPLGMMSATNDFYDFMQEYYDIYSKQDGVTLTQAWDQYKEYCTDAKVPYPLQRRIFREELKNYFTDFDMRWTTTDGIRVRQYYHGFKIEKFGEQIDPPEVKESNTWLKFEAIPSKLDAYCKDCSAQYATVRETPRTSWEKCDSKLVELDTSKLHYVKVPEHLIVIDFDIPDKDGNKNLELNLAEASKWPKTYAELSKSGQGIHLHYIYEGDVSKLSRVYADHIEIKIFTGGSALRRKLTKCNDISIATITSGLPLRGEDKVINWDGLKNDAALRTYIRRCLKKEYPPHATKPMIDYIYKALEDANTSGMCYNVENLYTDILSFATSSTHNKEYCVKMVQKMKLKSDSFEDNVRSDDENDLSNITFFDIEVFPNLVLVNAKRIGEGQPMIRMINPTSLEIENLISGNKLVGFNCRKYDNHILYAIMLGKSVKEIFNLSQDIIVHKHGFFGPAYNISYTDIYDFCSKKQSLKKWEIELGFHHQELGLRWDEPVPEELWPRVSNYCDNDVLATEAVWNARQGDFLARQILADVAGMTVNDTTNSLTTRIIFGNDKTPQGEFEYRNMGDDSGYLHSLDDLDCDHEYTKFNSDNKPVFPGYLFENRKSTYRGEEVGEGGYVFAKPGMYGRVITFDVASMHPSSIIAENFFGPKYTARFNDILQARIAIKHKDFDKAKGMLDGKLSKYLDDPGQAKALSGALKIAINSVYGLTSANFENPFKHQQNIDNLVAKRGALFMINLKHEVQNKGYEVVHIKTDSIKIANPDKDISDFVLAYGKAYGYNFEIEHKFERICLVNNAVYIAKLAEDDPEDPGKWTATGTQFAVPYVFKTLFSKEPIEFKDICETKSVTSAIYLDMNEGLADGEHNYIFVGKVGEFCPIKSGAGGGELLRETDNGYSAVVGSKGYRWLESEVVQANHKENDIDKSYYSKLVDDAVDTISKYGDIEIFLD